jgi:signal transduction histidine kinase
LVRPLVRRIARLSRAAERVGETSGYQSAERGAHDELGQVASALDRAHTRIRDDAARLETKQRDLQRHLADVTHDLRTPIASLQIAIEQAALATRDEAVSELLSGALRDAVYLGGLTDNLRLASELREGLSLAPGDAQVDLAEIVARVGERMRFYATHRGISLETSTPETPVLVRVHAVAAEQAVRNLVENAIAYGDSGGHVALLLDVPDPGEFVLSVVDDGPGVAPTEIARLGERTFRSDEARQRDPRGSGLGLAITAEVCVRSDFTLTFAAESPRGLRVTIRGPVAK